MLKVLTILDQLNAEWVARYLKPMGDIVSEVHGDDMVVDVYATHPKTPDRPSVHHSLSFWCSPLAP